MFMSTRFIFHEIQTRSLSISDHVSISVDSYITKLLAFKFVIWTNEFVTNIAEMWRTNSQHQY